MKIDFKHETRLDGHPYPRGVNEIPDTYKDHWYILALIKTGGAKLTEAPAPARAPVDPSLLSGKAKAASMEGKQVKNRKLVGAPDEKPKKQKDTKPKKEE